MNIRRHALPLVAASALLLAGGLAAAQPSAAPAGDARAQVARHDGGDGHHRWHGKRHGHAHGHGHHGRGHMMHGMDMGHRLEGRLAFLKAELNLTEAQTPLWNAFADAMRANAKAQREVRKSLRAEPRPSAVPERLDRAEQTLAARLEGLKAMRATFTPLYDGLTDAQKKTADELFRGRFGMAPMPMRRM